MMFGRHRRANISYTIALTATLTRSPLVTDGTKTIEVRDRPDEVITVWKPKTQHHSEDWRRNGKRKGRRK